MSSDLLKPHAILSPQRALEASQQAPNILRRYSQWNVPWPLTLLLNSDNPDKWTIYENLFHTCLRTGDNEAAQKCLKQMLLRFGETNDRVMAMMGLYREATAKNNEELEKILIIYEDAIKEKPSNIVLRKRHAALLKSLGRLADATIALTELLDLSPIDAEAWTELGELYVAQGAFAQAIYCLEEVLLVVPNAWNMHVRLGEVLYIAAIDSPENRSALVKLLARSTKSFCRSVELCDNYLRGFYGLKLATSELQKAIPKLNSRDVVEDDFPLPLVTTIQKLNELATSKLAEIVRRFSTTEKDWDGYDEAEIIAARALLDKETSSAPR